MCLNVALDSIFPKKYLTFNIIIDYKTVYLDIPRYLFWSSNSGTVRIPNHPLLVSKQSYILLIPSFRIVLKSVSARTTANQIRLSVIPRASRPCAIQTSEPRNRWGEKNTRIFMIILRGTRCNFTVVLHVRANWCMCSRLINATRLKTGTRYGNRGLREQCCVIILASCICVLTYGHVPEIGTRILRTTTGLSYPFR